MKMEEQILNEVPHQTLLKTDIIYSVYRWFYIISKLGMIYTILTSNWIAVIGFTIASVVTYIEAMKRS